ncbi:MAG: SpvB/TcaC N-terminal domain-containing protein, partial [Blastocatellia bacterium]
MKKIAYLRIMIVLVGFAFLRTAKGASGEPEKRVVNGRGSRKQRTPSELLYVGRTFRFKAVQLLSSAFVALFALGPVPAAFANSVAVHKVGANRAKDRSAALSSKSGVPQADSAGQPGRQARQTSATFSQQSQPQNGELSATAMPDTLSHLPKADLSTGALTYSYPIVTPPGRNGMEPHLSIDYNSQELGPRKITNWFGIGWNLDIPYIERVNKRGVDQLATGTDFTSSLSGELVATGANSYAAKSESGDFLQYSLANNGWTVTDKKGRSYTFGSDVSGRVSDAQPNPHIFRWMLERVQEPNGNFMVYNYTG